MMKYVFTLSLFLIIGLETVFAQSVWKLKEQRPNNKLYELDSSLAHHNVDISSLIYIQFDKNNIRRKLLSASNQEVEVEMLINKIQLLERITTQGLKSIPEYTQGMDAYAKAKNIEEKVKIVETMGQSFATLALELMYVAEQDPELSHMLNTNLEKVASTGFANSFTVLLQTTKEYVSGLENKLSQLVQKEGLYIQLAATLHSSKGGTGQPIHIDGFDHIKPPEYYDPYELNLVLTDEQIQELEALKRTCDSINTIGIPALIAQKKEQLRGNLKKILLELDSLVTDLSDQTKQIEVSDIPVESIRIEYKTFKQNIVALQTAINTLYTKYFEDDLSFAMVFQSSFLAEIRNIMQQTDLIYNNANKINRLIDESTASVEENVDSAMGFLNKTLEEFGIKQINLSKKKMNILYSELTGYRSFNEISRLTASFSDKIIKKDLKDLPDQAILNIKHYAGYREEGDNIVMEMRGGRKEQKPKTIEAAYFSLVKTQPHFVTNVGIAFVRPNGANEKFTAVVSSNTLFKFGTQAKNTFYRKYIDLGVGINVATLNFNADNPFEFGAAGVLSAFNDYLIGGYGYNFTQGKGYLLVSIRVPFLHKELIY